MRKVTALAGALLLASSFTAVAGEGFYAGPSASYYFLDRDRVVTGDANESLIMSGNLGYRFAGPWALEAGWGAGMFSDDDIDDDMDVVKVDALYFLGDNRENWAPYLVAGFTDFSRDSNPRLEDDEEDTQQLGFGFGISKMVQEQFEVRTDARLLQKVSGGESGTTDLALNLAFNYYFSKPAAPAPVVEAAPPPQETPATRTITVRLNVEFEFDKAVVRNIYGDELNAVANAMKEHDDINLVLEGHTDSIGTDAYNQDLSERRVAAVKARLVQDYGIPAGRISTVGYGESRPIADNSTDEGRARNRRVIGELSYTEVVND